MGLVGSPRSSATPQSCPVCNSEKTEPSFKHRLFDTIGFSCHRCDHRFVPEIEVISDQSRKHFKTNERRADFYAMNVLRYLDFESVVDIGVPPDLLLLNLLHRVKPAVRKYAYDLFPIKTPEYVTFLDDLGQAPSVDVAIALHVVEHIPDRAIHNFVAQVSDLARWFILEVPNCSRRPDDREPHYHFFTPRSFSSLVEPFGAHAHRIVGFGPRRRPALIAYRLPEGVAIHNGLSLH